MTEKFIEKSKNVHGDRYDYSKVNYIDNKIKVVIICKEHSEFEQLPNVHIKGSGCKKCSIEKNTNSKRKSQEEFIRECIEKHGDKYDYSKVDYKNNSTNIIIGCKFHGFFQQAPKKHLQSRGCQICSAGFVEKSKLLYGETYDYSMVDYKNIRTPVKIICKMHGFFCMKPTYHLSGGKCPKCSIRNFTTEQFIEKSIAMHGDLYDYSESIYINNNEKVIIICNRHGRFLQNSRHHYSTGSGCPNCITQVSKMQIKWLNFLSKLHNINIRTGENGGEFIIPDTKYKADGYCIETNTIYEFHGNYWHGNPKLYDANLFNKRTDCTFGELYRKTQKKEETIKSLGYNLVVMWENDWKKINQSIKKFQQHFRKRKIVIVKK